MSNDEDVPPLEDMSGEVKKRFGKDYGVEEDTKPKTIQPTITESHKPLPTRPKDEDGWFKKGFLVNPSKPVEDITHIKANPEAKNKIPEVQAKMHGQIQDQLLKNKEQWLTQDLLTNIMSNNVMTQSAKDPELQKV